MPRSTLLFRRLRAATVVLTGIACGFLSLRAQSTFDVKTFGATGDGTTDDTDAIARASSAAAQRGGTLVFSTGTYIFDPGRAKVLVGSNMKITGPGTLKVKPDAGNYEYVIGAANPATPLQNVTLDGLHVDQNVEQNSSSTIVVRAAATTGQFVFFTYNIRGLRVRNCTFDASGINTVVANGAKVDNVVFENNTVTFHQRQGQPNFDNSAFYFSGIRGQVTGNRCQAPPAVAAVGCIEVHHGSSKVENNTMDNYLTGIYVVDVDSAQITNNTGTNIDNGIFIEASRGHECRNIEITGNKFSINNVDRHSDETAGIAANYENYLTGTIDGLTIRDNEITFQPETQPRRVKYPGSNWGISTQFVGPVHNVKIIGNRIANASVRAIKIGENSPGAEQSDIVIENNTITDAGYNSDGSVAPLRAAVAAEGDLRNVAIRGNTITQSSAPGGVYSIWFGDHGSYSNVQYSESQVSGKSMRKQVPRDVAHSEQ